VDCLRTLPNRFREGKKLYFEEDDTFYFDTGGALEVTVEYLDEGTAPLELHYDSADASAPVAGAYKSAGSVARQGSGSWKRAGFTLTEARLVNRQNLASDFRLYTPSGVLTVRCVAVRRID
jgi:hypothetical protein